MWCHLHGGEIAGGVIWCVVWVCSWHWGFGPCVLERAGCVDTPF
jgi:hypothetical protein